MHKNWNVKDTQKKANIDSMLEKFAGEDSCCSFTLQIIRSEKNKHKQEKIKDDRTFSSYLQAVWLPCSNELGHQEVGVEKVHVLI